jgi:hypothetical protein
VDKSTISHHPLLEIHFDNLASKGKNIRPSQGMFPNEKLGHSADSFS